MFSFEDAFEDFMVYYNPNSALNIKKKIALNLVNIVLCGACVERVKSFPLINAGPRVPSGGVTLKRRCTYRPSVIYLIVNKLLSLSLSLSLLLLLLNILLYH